MAIFTDLNEVNNGTKHCICETSRIKATLSGNLYDVIVRNGETAIDVDNGCLVKVGSYTGTNGLQERYGTVAVDGDKVALVCDVALIKDAFTKAQNQPYNYYNKAGVAARTYELEEHDVFGISKEFVTGTIAVGSYVKFDASTKKYVIANVDPSATNGFVGKVHSLVTGTYYDLVRIEVIQNKTIA